MTRSVRRRTAGVRWGKPSLCFALLAWALLLLAVAGCGAATEGGLLTPAEGPTLAPARTDTAVPTTAAPPASGDCLFVGNKSSGVFHGASCGSVRQMSVANRVCLPSREEAISQGFRPCQNCRP
jgi:competence protein ComEC